jgi:hypothetical protein
MNNPAIRIVPSDAEIERLVDELIELTNADIEADALRRLIFAVAGAAPGNVDQYHVANRIVEYAWRKTSDYQRCFENFARLNPRTSSAPDAEAATHLEQQQQHDEERENRVN